MIYLQIFWVFFRISWMSFGGVFGVLPELQKMVVTQQGWISAEQFIQSYVVSQFVPGPNMAMCPLIGYWVAGWGGWLAGFVGIYSAPLVVMGATFALYRRYRNLETVRHVERGLRPMILGLFVSSSLRLWWSQSEALSGDTMWTHRLASVVVMTLGGWAYYTKRIGPLTVVFAMGVLWWGLSKV